MKIQLKDDWQARSSDINRAKISYSKSLFESMSILDIGTLR